MAYADDITQFVTNPIDIPALADTLQRHGKATGARVNIRKSESNGGGCLELHSKHDESPILHRNDHTGIPVFEHGVPIGGRGAGQG